MLAIAPLWVGECEWEGVRGSLRARARVLTTAPSFVTGLADTEQDGVFKSSMYETAKQIGLPASFVDIRHDAIHGDLPSLIVLREAVAKALDWLWHDYWKHLAVSTDTREEGGAAAWNAQRETSNEKARSILRAYRSTVLTSRPPSRSATSTLDVEVNNTCLGLVRLCKEDKPALVEVVNVLLEEDCILPRSRSHVLPCPRE